MHQKIAETELKRLQGLSAKDGRDALWEGLEILLPHLDQQVVATLQSVVDQALILDCFSVGECALFLLVDRHGQLHFGQVQPLMILQTLALASFNPASDELGSVVVTRQLRIAGDTRDILIVVHCGKDGVSMVYHGEIAQEREWCLRPVHYGTPPADGWLPVPVTALPEWLVAWTVRRSADPPIHHPPDGLRKLNPVKRALVLCSATHSCVIHGENVCILGPEGDSSRFSLTMGCRIAAMQEGKQRPYLIALRQDRALLLDPADNDELGISLITEGAIAQIAFTGDASAALGYLVAYTDGRLVHLRQAKDQRLSRLWRKLWLQLALGKDEFDRCLRQVAVQPQSLRSLVIKRQSLERNAISGGSSENTSAQPDPMLDIAYWLCRERRRFWKRSAFLQADTSRLQIWSVNAYQGVYLESAAVFEAVSESHNRYPEMKELITKEQVLLPANLNHIAHRREYTATLRRDIVWRPVMRRAFFLPEALDRPPLHALILSECEANRELVFDPERLDDKNGHGLTQRIKETLSHMSEQIQSDKTAEETLKDTRALVSFVPFSSVGIKLGKRYGQFLSTAGAYEGLPLKSPGRTALASMGLMAALAVAASEPLLAALGSLAFFAIGLRRAKRGSKLWLVIASDDDLNWSFCSRLIHWLSERHIATLDDPFWTELFASSGEPPDGSCLFNLQPTKTRRRLELLLVKASAWEGSSPRMQLLIDSAERVLCVQTPGSFGEAPWDAHLHSYHAKVEQIAWRPYASADDDLFERLSGSLR